MSRACLALALVVAAGSADALRLGVPATPVAAPRAFSPIMALPSVEDAKSLTDEEIKQEIFNAKKELFELRKNVKTRQQVKPHLFTHTKHRIAQLSQLLGSRPQ